MAAVTQLEYGTRGYSSVTGGEVTAFDAAYHLPIDDIAMGAGIGRGHRGKRSQGDKGEDSEGFHLQYPFEQLTTTDCTEFIVSVNQNSHLLLRFFQIFGCAYRDPENQFGFAHFPPIWICISRSGFSGVACGQVKGASHCWLAPFFPFRLR
jgi:hypothetical protein